MAKDNNNTALWWVLGLGAATAVGIGILSQKKDVLPVNKKGKNSDEPVISEWWEWWEPKPEPQSQTQSVPDQPQDALIMDRVSQGMQKLPSWKYYSKPRKMGLVNSLVLHGMGFDRGSDPTKYDKVNAHFIILRDGQIVQLQPLNRYLKASNGFNKYAVSVEFAGNHRSYKGKCWRPETFGCHNLTVPQVQSGRYLIDFLASILPDMGSPGLQGVYAHRQSSKKKPNGPGPEIWYNIGEWASSERGLYTGTDDGYKIGDGRAIRDEWRDPKHGIVIPP